VLDVERQHPVEDRGLFVLRFALNRLTTHAQRTGDPGTGEVRPAEDQAHVLVERREAKIIPIAATLTPIKGSAADELKCRQISLGIARLAKTYGIPCIDFYSQLSDGVTGGWVSTRRFSPATARILRRSAPGSWVTSLSRRFAAPSRCRK
jgi:hypothetical protein